MVAFKLKGLTLILWFFFFLRSIFRIAYVPIKFSLIPQKHINEIKFKSSTINFKFLLPFGIPSWVKCTHMCASALLMDLFLIMELLEKRQWVDPDVIEWKKKSVVLSVNNVEKFTQNAIKCRHVCEDESNFVYIACPFIIRLPSSLNQ